MVVAFIALFVAIGGSSYAVTRLPAGSVGSKQLRQNAVTGAKVKNRSLTAADINVSSLTGVASAASAANAANAASATHAGAAAALDTVTYVTQPGTVDRATPDDAGGFVPTLDAATAACPAGTFVVGGGVGLDDHTNMAVVDSFPEPGGRAWTARVHNNDGDSGHAFTVVAICVVAIAAA
jgi:hypothetical protein